MVLLIWLRLILSVTCVVLLLVWYFNGRKPPILLRIAGACILLASILFFMSR
jgi:hypothetical protein